MEQWKPIDGWCGYEVSNMGRVRSHKRSRRYPDATLPRVLSGYSLPSGYVMVDTKDRGLRGKHYVHRLVAAAFIGTCPDGREVAHLDGDPANNRAENLTYATPKENAAHKVRHGTWNGGGKHYAAHLTDEQARKVFAHEGGTADAARVYGVPYHVAYNIRTRRTYRRATESSDG